MLKKSLKGEKKSETENYSLILYNYTPGCQIIFPGKPLRENGHKNTR